MENKICVYTVCMNEAKFVNRWVDSMQEADRIVALVHDCTDNTEELLRARGVTIGKTHYDEWRFDVGKNDSMHLAMKEAPECNILVFVSLDEVWDPGWADIVRKEWNENVNIACYKFVQTHDEDGNDALATGFDWMHSNDPGWYWKYPVDERIMSDTFEKKYLNLFDKIKLNHWPDYSVRERKYCDLRAKAFDEYKDTPSRIALSREYSARGMWKELYEILKDYDIEKDEQTTPEEKAYFCVYLANCYKNIEGLDRLRALDLYKRALELASYLRDAYVEYGAYLCDVKCFAEAEFVLERSLVASNRIYSWLENPDNWTCNPHIWLTVACYYQGKYFKALGYAYAAKLMSPENSVVVGNLKLCEDKIKEILGGSSS